MIGRRQLGIDDGDTSTFEPIPYRNIPQAIGAVISSRLATKVELDTVLGLEDVYDLLEILAIDGHNRALAHKSAGGG